MRTRSVCSSLCLAAAFVAVLVFAGHSSHPGPEAAERAGSVAIWWPDSAVVGTVG
ncbi:hypothetical protein GCM10009759_39560 [Kitasatospora saccharophila]|uniref:Uncharacterized protein n=1 Tax=Kitasatospora saccharophila TaxID=407973 RepID=A0ABP5IRJ0_9ACTN